jgi:hypothetical protein
MTIHILKRVLNYAHVSLLMMKIKVSTTEWEDLGYAAVRTNFAKSYPSRPTAGL